MRDIKKQVQQGRTLIKKHERADLTAKELEQIYNGFTASVKEDGLYSALCDAIMDSYYMGVAVGSRNA